MDWGEKFYSRTGEWWGPAEARIAKRDHQRVALVENTCGSAPQSVLELGSGYGSTASVTADHGFTVTGCELSERIDFAHQFETDVRRGRLRFVKGDFYKADLGGPYDIATYWNGFGIGTDADQRRLLRRIATEWLAPNGRALVAFFLGFCNGVVERCRPPNGDSLFKNVTGLAHCTGVSTFVRVSINAADAVPAQPVVFHPDSLLVCRSARRLRPIAFEPRYGRRHERFS